MKRRDAIQGCAPLAIAASLTIASLIAWAIWMVLAMGFLMYANDPTSWSEVVIRLYPAVVGLCLVAAFWLSRVGGTALSQAAIAVLPVPLLAAAAFAFSRPGAPLSNLEFASRRERALAVAARTGDLEALDALLAKGVSPSVESDKGISALEVTVWGNHFAAFARLLEAGASPVPRADSPDRAPRNDAVGAILHDWDLKPEPAEWLALLLRHGLPPDWREPTWNATLLHRAAAEADSPSLVRVLLDHGADPLARRGLDGYTPFCASVKACSWRAALELIPAMPLIELECAVAELHRMPGVPKDGPAAALQASLQAALERRAAQRPGAGRPDALGGRAHAPGARSEARAREAQGGGSASIVPFAGETR